MGLVLWLAQACAGGDVALTSPGATAPAAPEAKVEKTAPAATSAPLADGDGKTVAVIVEDQGGATQALRPVESLVISALKDVKARVLERALLEQLKKDELLQAAIRNRNASFFREVGLKYQTDLIVYMAISTDAEHGLGRHWIGSAVASGYLASTRSAEILASGLSPAMGTPGFPTVVGETALEARDGAARLSVGVVLARLGLPVDVGVIPTDLRISLKTHWKKSVPGAPITSLSFGSGRSFLAGGRGDGTAQLWSIGPGELVTQLRPHASAVASIALSADDELLVTGGHDGRVVLAQLPSGHVLRDWSVGSQASAVAFAPDRQTLAAGTGDGRVLLLDVRGVLPVQAVRGHEKAVNFVSYRRDGRQLITASEDLSVRFWDPQRFQRPLRIMREDIFRGQISRGALSRDGEFLALATKEIDIDLLKNRRVDTRKIRLVRTLTGEEIHRFRAHDKDIAALSFGPSRRILASAAEDGELKIWDAERARDIDRLSFGRGVRIHAVAFSPNGDWIAASVADSLVLWKVE